MNDAETSTVEQTVRINARPETVWKYWTDSQRMCDWWGAVAELDARPGGVCRIEMDGGPVMIGEYLELVPYERLVFSFGWKPTEGAPDIPPGTSQVEVILTDDAGGTLLTLRHTGIPAGLAKMHAAGWSHFLPILVHAADEGGKT